MSKGSLRNTCSQNYIIKGKNGHSSYHHTVLGALTLITFHKKHSSLEPYIFLWVKT